MSCPGKNIRVWDKSTNPGFADGKEVSVIRHILNWKAFLIFHRLSATYLLLCSWGFMITLRFNLISLHLRFTSTWSALDLYSNCPAP